LDLEEIFGELGAEVLVEGQDVGEVIRPRRRGEEQEEGQGCRESHKQRGPLASAAAVGLLVAWVHGRRPFEGHRGTLVDIRRTTPSSPDAPHRNSFS
jgi:hypothetical protein